MLKICVQNPTFLLGDLQKNFNGYNFEFLRRYVKFIYITDLSKYFRYRQFCMNMGLKEIKFIFSVSNLNKYIDILICFNGLPHKIFHRPPKNYTGIKIFHTMDFIFHPKLANKFLCDSAVNYLMTYNDHYKYSTFFKNYYPSFENKLISVPFGYGDRFTKKNDFNSRLNKALALGSVNPIFDKNCNSNSVMDYVTFYPKIEFTHIVRREIVLRRHQLRNLVDDFLPTFPITKNPDYNAVELLNKYTMFINDEGIMNFPPARTYEGIACGCVMVANRNQIYLELGFIDGVNCILFEPNNIEDMCSKINYYIQNPEILYDIHLQSIELAKKFNHKSIAEQLHNTILDKVKM